MTIDVERLRQLIRSNTETLCRHFVPSGRKESQEWKIGDGTGAAGNSLVIALSGERAGFWHDRATGDGGDFIMLIMLNRGVSFSEAADLIGAALGVSVRAGQANYSAFNWDQCVKDFTLEQILRVAAERSVKEFTIQWLCDRNLIGFCPVSKWAARCIAFPIHGGNGEVFRAHCRSPRPGADGKYEWCYEPFDPEKRPVSALLFGKREASRVFYIFESQWDAIALIDKLDLGEEIDAGEVCVIITRGAEIAGRLNGLSWPDKAAIYAFPQNDQPDQSGIIASAKWLRDVLVATGGCYVVRTPPQHKDLNAWTRAGAVSTDLEAAIDHAGIEKPQTDFRTEDSRADEKSDRASQKIDLLLPSGPVSFSEAARNIFPVLARRRRYFVRYRMLVEIAYRKLLKDKQLHDAFQPLEPDAFRIRLEEDFKCCVWREDHGKYVKKASRCTNDSAKVLLKSDAAIKHLPAISFLSAQPVYTIVEGEPKILYRGYHDVHGGVYVSHGETPILLPSLDHAVALILGALKDYDFVSPSDKSRAVASFLSPALRIGKFLGDTDFPIDIAEADESQGGKTYRHRLVCALYGETPYIIANREGGVGSIDESISSALIAGTPFILIENYRGKMNSQLLETCLRGTGVAPARIPHRGEVQVSTTHINWQLSSNGLEATRDFVNRAIINRISKRVQGFKFTRYPQGDILAHVKADQPQYLGAVFRIIREWFDQGCRRTEENRHDFTQWAQTLDWIVQNIFNLPPLLDGHVEEVLRVSDSALSWLRQVGIAVEKDKRLDEALSASEIVDICLARGSSSRINSLQLTSINSRCTPAGCWAGSFAI
jgi:hypothetical protein